MKRISFLIILFVFAAAKISYAQKGAKGFEGQISYTIEYIGEMDPATKAQAPTAIDMYFKGSQARMEQSTAMGKAIVISDYNTMEQIVLLDMLGNKWAIKSSKEDTQKALDETPKATVTITEETKTIAGVICKKAEVTVNEKTEIFWFTTEYGIEKANWNMPWSDIPGVLMEYIQNQGDISMKITAKEVKKSKLKDSLFTATSDYQVMSAEEFRSMFGGGE
jgi:GLPGLI family protein